MYLWRNLSYLRNIHNILLLRYSELVEIFKHEHKMNKNISRERQQK